jgi:hypothetical protein
VYALDVRVKYTDGSEEIKKQDVVVVERGEVFTRHAFFTLFFPFETSLSGVVTVYRQNDVSRQFEGWDAARYDQNNPQWTDQKGEYVLGVPKGNYHVKFSAKAYTEKFLSYSVLSRDTHILNDRVELSCRVTQSWVCMWDIKLLILLALCLLVWCWRRRYSNRKQ